MIFKAAPHQHLIIGQHSRGQRVARKPAQAFAIKCKIIRQAAVYQTTTFCKTCAHLKALPVGSFCFDFRY